MAKTTASQWLRENPGDADKLDEVFASSGVPMGVIAEHPRWMREQIAKNLQQTFEKPYWRDIHQTFQGDAERHLKQGLKEGHSIRKMAKSMADRFLGDTKKYARQRAMNIARTESGHALNGARKSGMEQVTGDPKLGRSVRPVWLSVLGNTTRDAHANLDGVPADKDGMWELNGVKIPWPGHVDLPPADRCNCQCSIVMEFGLTDQESERLLAEYERREERRLAGESVGIGEQTQEERQAEEEGKKPKKEEPEEIDQVQLDAIEEANNLIGDVGGSVFNFQEVVFDVERAEKPTEDDWLRWEQRLEDIREEIDWLLADYESMMAVIQDENILSDLNREMSSHMSQLSLLEERLVTAFDLLLEQRPKKPKKAFLSEFLLRRASVIKGVGYNPYRDEFGRFASSPSVGIGTGGGSGSGSGGSGSSGKEGRPPKVDPVGQEIWGKKKEDYVGKPPQKGDFDSEDEWLKACVAYRDKEAEWGAATRMAVGEGHLTVKEAEERGEHFTMNVPRKPGLAGGPDIPETPPVLYHATTAKDAVKSDRLRTRDELSQASGAGLGGGARDTISFTDDPEIARGIARGIHEAHRVAKGDLTIKELVENARTGKDADRPYLEDVIRNGGGYSTTSHPDWKSGDPLPKDWQLVVEGKKKVTGLAFTEDDIKSKGGTPLGDGWEGSDGKKRYFAYAVPREGSDLRYVNFQQYKVLARNREHAGGPMDPLFFSNDVDALAKMNPDQIGVFRCRMPEGYRGYKVSGLGEWRTWSGRGVELEEMPTGTSESKSVEKGYRYSIPDRYYTKQKTEAPSQRYAKWVESDLAKKLKGKTHTKGHPVDITLTVSDQLHGIEVKTLLWNGDDKIAQHPEDKARKKKWAEETGGIVHTVVVDDREVIPGKSDDKKVEALKRFDDGDRSGFSFRNRKVYYKAGYGSFRIGGMEGVSIGEIRGKLNKTNEEEKGYGYNPYRDPTTGQFTSSPMGPTSMVSPSVQDIGIGEAVSRLDSPRQKALAEKFAEVDSLMGLKSKRQNAIGAWDDGAENSTIAYYSSGTDYKEARAAACMKGLLARQKAVLSFQESKDGNNTMLEMELDGSDMVKHHNALEKAGVVYHTLIPSGDKTRVNVYDEDGSSLPAVVEFAKSQSAKITARKGKGEFIGGDTREEGRKAYEDVIRKTIGTGREGGGGSGGRYERWENLRDDWFANEVKRFGGAGFVKGNPYHDPRSGRFTTAPMVGGAAPAKSPQKMTGDEITDYAESLVGESDRKLSGLNSRLDRIKGEAAAAWEERWRLLQEAKSQKTKEKLDSIVDKLNKGSSPDVVTDDLADYQNALSADYEQAKGKLSTINEKIDGLVAKRNELTKEIRREREVVDQKLKESLTLNPSDRCKVEPRYDEIDHQFSPEAKEGIREGVDTFQKYVHRDAVKSPEHTIRSNEPTMMATRRVRAQYIDDRDKTLQLNKDKVGTKSVCHELGHWMDHITSQRFDTAGTQDVGRASAEFLRSRTEGAESVKLGEGYKDHETYFPRTDGGEWIDNYMGRDYGTLQKRAETQSEITSMGIQEYITNPSKFVAKDPEYFRYIAKVVRGEKVGD